MEKHFQIVILIYIYIFSISILNDLSVIFLTFLFLHVLYYVLRESNHTKGSFLYSLIFCATITIIYVYKNAISNEEKTFELESSVNLDPSKLNMFYLETDSKKEFISLRQMCSLESAAYRNPDANIYLYSLKAKIDPDFLKKFKNIRLVLTTPEEIYKDTPLEDWYQRDKEKLYKGRFFMHDLSDSMRLALVYKYGGYYSDLDVLNLQSLKPIQNVDGFGLENNKEETNSAVFIFKKNHPFFLTAFKELNETFKTDSWSYNGPLLVVRALRKYCETEDIFKKLKLEDNFEYRKVGKRSNSKCDVNMFPGRYFYPLRWETIKNVAFTPNANFSIDLFLNSYTVHFFNYLSRSIQVRLNSKSIYEYIASQSCPYTYGLLKLDRHLYF